MKLIRAPRYFDDINEEEDMDVRKRCFNCGLVRAYGTHHVPCPPHIRA